MKALRELSLSSGKSVADLMRQAVDRFLAQSSLSRQARAQRAMRVAGSFKSGTTDVSTHHDRYLAEAVKDRLE